MQKLYAGKISGQIMLTLFTLFNRMGVGSAAAYLPIYHHVFTDYSPHVVKELNEKGRLPRFPTAT